VPQTKPFPAPGPGGNRPGGGVTTLPAEVGGGNRPGIGGNRPGGGGNRPEIVGNRPDGIGNRPDGGVTALPGEIGGGNRPGGNRPSRPGIGGDRPSYWNRPGGGGDRHGIGGDRPGGWNRPGEWSRPSAINRPVNNRSIIGSGNNNSIGNTLNNLNVNNNFNNWGAGGWGGDINVAIGVGGLGGWGYGGGWGDAWNSGYVNPSYGWYNGCWSGNWGNGYYGGWAYPLAFGAATWGLSSLLSGWGLGYGVGYGASYVNPYYSTVPQTVVASSPYDYSQPIVVNNYVTNDGATSSSDSQGGGGASASATAQPAANEATALFDAALAKFKAGDYSAALAGCDKAVKLSPGDSVIHEVRALALFALGRYPEAAATLNAVLASAPGMDWTSMSSLYGSVDAYTAHLRKLEAACKASPGDAAAHFVLAYHYLVGGHVDLAREALAVVVAKQPGDLVAKRILEALAPPPEEKSAEQSPAPAAEAAAKPAAEATETAAAPGPETDLVGVWKADAGRDSVVLTVREDSTFTWKATPAGKAAVELSGTIETAADAIALVTDGQRTMAGKVTSKGADAFDFFVVGAPADAKPLEFKRQAAAQ
jgi:tetratricopeptide (TPR) repeat protein